jgi:hypothetical protein
MNRESFWETGWGVLTGLFLVMVIVITLIFGAVIIVESKSCRETANQMGLEYDYGFWSDCQVNVDGQWVPLDNYRIDDKK